MAWVPAEAEKDDLICLLFGGATPFVLRPVQDGHIVWLGLVTCMASCKERRWEAKNGSIPTCRISRLGYIVKAHLVD